MDNKRELIGEFEMAPVRADGLTITGLHQHRLQLASEGRAAYAADGPLREELQAEARAFQIAAELIDDPERLKGLIPSHMWNQIR